MKKGLWIAGAVVVLILGLFVWWITGNGSEGERVGTITKCSVKGKISKTHECEALVGGGGAVAAVSSNVWAFTVTDKDWEVLSVDLQASMDTGLPVKLFYIQPRVTNPFRTETGYYVIKTELRGAKPPGVQ